MANLAKGSSGEEVKQLQQQLNSVGNYGLSVDGIYGDNTYNAVRDYQSKNGLSVDGIVGTNTWGSLFGTGGGTAGTASGYTDTGVSSGGGYSMPTASLPSFESYLNSSGYEKYKKEITDAINAQTERAVNAYNKQIEETEDNQEKMARQAYIAKMQSQRNLDQQLSAAGYAGGMADSQRIRVESDYNNALADIDTQRQNEVDALERAIEDARLNGDSELASYLAEYQQAASANYQSYVQQIQAQQYADAKEAAAAAAAAQAASYSSGGGGNYSGGGYDNGGLTTSQIKQLQSVLGVTADGLYGSASRAAAGGLSAAEAYAKYVGGGGTQASGAASWSDVKRTISGYLSTGQVSKANQLASSVYGQLSQAQRNELAQMGMTIG